MKLTTKELTQSAIFTALICVMSIITIPIGIVPVTLSLLGVMLAAVILGTKKGVVSVLIYILCGLIGLPVFSGFKGGIQVIVGPTGGYIYSYLLTALIIGVVSDKLKPNGIMAYVITFFSCCFGILFCYLFGTLHFAAVTDVSLSDAFFKCVAIFIPFDIIKAVVASFVGNIVKKRLKFI